MKKILTEIKKYSIILIIVCAVLGALLVAFPDRMLAYTSLFIGGAFIATNSVKARQMVRDGQEQVKQKMSEIKNATSEKSKS